MTNTSFNNSAAAADAPTPSTTDGHGVDRATATPLKLVSGRPTRSSVRGVLASESRLHLLDALRKSERGMDTTELAALFGLHVSTVRFHLAELTRAGFVTSKTEPSTGRGRPRHIYYPVTVGSTVTQGDPSAEADIEVSSHESMAAKGYERLARILAASWMDEDASEADLVDDALDSGASGAAGGDGLPNGAHPEASGVTSLAERRAMQTRRRAERAGRAWASSEIHVESSGAEPSALSAATMISGMFAEMGFDPELREGDDGAQILLHACPFESVAKDYPDVVCSMHLGLLRGALEELGADVTAELSPKVGPHLCVASVTRLKAGGPTSDR